MLKIISHQGKEIKTILINHLYLVGRQSIRQLKKSSKDTEELELLYIAIGNV